MKDYYAILGVNPDADRETIRTVFRKLCHIYHPDKGLEVSQARMTDIYEAYDVLSDPQRRAEYDRQYQLKGTRPSDRPSGVGQQDAQGSAPTGDPDASRTEPNRSKRQRDRRGDGKAAGTATTDRAGGAHTTEAPQRSTLFGWPRWRHQRYLLIAGIPTGVLLGVLGIVAKVPLFALVGMAVAAGTAYVGVKTDWLQQLGSAERSVHFVGRACLVSTIAILGIAGIYVAIWIAGV